MNKVILLGRLTKDVELKHTSNNTAVASFTLAVNRKFKQENQPTADFINIVAWGKTAEFANNYFKKGLQINVVGRIQNRSWDDEKGQKHYATDIVAEEVYFADSKRDSNSNSNLPESSYNSESSFTPINSEDDDLPF
jgi:single-strand DNA-binding protein